MALGHPPRPQPRRWPGRGGSPVPPSRGEGEDEDFGLIPHPLSARRRRGERDPEKSRERDFGERRPRARGCEGLGGPPTPPTTPTPPPTLGEPMSEAEPTQEAAVEVGVPIPLPIPVPVPPPPSPAGTGGSSRGSCHGVTGRGWGGEEGRRRRLRDRKRHFCGGFRPAQTVLLVMGMAHLRRFRDCSRRSAAVWWLQLKFCGGFCESSGKSAALL